MPRSLWVPIALLVALAALGGLVARQAPGTLDVDVSLGLQAGLPDALRTPLEWISVALLGIWATVCTVVVLALVAWRAGPRSALFVLVVTLIAALLMTAAKDLYARPRPAAPIEVMAPHPASWSFPSGHVTWTSAVLGAALVVLCRGRRRRVRVAGGVGLGAAVVVVGVSRVYLGQHYVTDVFGGALLGFACLTAVVAVRPPAVAN